MKLVIKEYLAALRERDELDAILPDLLSQMGLNVFSRPKRGTLQYGVDVAAFGSLDGKTEKIYLFSIKAGDVTRNSWNAEGPQSLRQSLDDILDSYIPARIPAEYKRKGIVICLCFGGDVLEQVRQSVEGYINRNKSKRISFEQWNGDKLASLIESYFLREELLPKNERSLLRKSLALLDESDASYKHFCGLIRSFLKTKDLKQSEQLRALRQMNICLRILHSWAREGGNIESPYLASEFTLLHAWEIAKSFINKKSKISRDIIFAFQSILDVYENVSEEYLNKIVPHADKLHGLSTEVRASNYLDTNLKMFDLLGRLGLAGSWVYWSLSRTPESQAEIREQLIDSYAKYTSAIKSLIVNNSALLLPAKDDHFIDIFIAVLFLSTDASDTESVRAWLHEMTNRAEFAFRIKRYYPSTIDDYAELLDHPKNDDDYFEEVTKGSVLFPMIALWASLFSDDDLYKKIQIIKEKHLKHCNFQFWYPDESSEDHIYINSDLHGAVLSHVCIQNSTQEFVDQALSECDASPQFSKLSAVNIWPMILAACRHYRIPIPLHLMRGFQNPTAQKIPMT